MAAEELKEIICNEAIIRQIAEDMKLNIGTVEDIIKSVSSFTANTIRTGGLEGVMIPYLGKFQVKHRSQQYKDFKFALNKDMYPLLKQNKNRIVDGEDENETIHNRC